MTYTVSSGVLAYKCDNVMIIRRVMESAVTVSIILKGCTHFVVTSRMIVLLMQSAQVESFLKLSAANP